MSTISKKSESRIDDFEFISSYDGNESIKGPGTKIEYTKEMIQEYIKCKNDLIYFIENYYYIVTLDKGLVLIDLWDFQREFLEHIKNNRFSIVLASRQVGKSVITIGYLLWYALFHPHKYVALLSKRAEDASDLMSKLKRSYECIPKWLQQNVTKWAATSLKLENGTEIKSQATTENAGRSASANILFLDEFAFVPTNIANKFYSSAYPTISNSEESQVIICSTPNGHNHFYVMQDKAEKGENEYKKLVIRWDQVPGRDEAWKETVIKNISMEDGQDGSMIFSQEYDLNFENSTLRSFLESAIQRKLANYLSSTSLREIEYPNTPNLKIFELPEKGMEYFLTADCAEGVGGDFSAFSIMKIEENKYKQVAVYKNNTIKPTPYAYLIDEIGRFYNESLVLVECESAGISVLDTLFYDIDYDNLYHNEKKTLGMKTRKNNRNKGLIKLKEYIEYDIIEINDYDTFVELTKFSKNKKDKFVAEEGFNDDLVMGLVLFSYLTTIKEFFDDYEGKNIAQKMKDEMEEENPFLETIKLMTNDNGVETIVSNQDYFGRGW